MQSHCGTPSPGSLPLSNTHHQLPLIKGITYWHNINTNKETKNCHIYLLLAAMGDDAMPYEDLYEAINCT